jgi:hypothetical protein
MPDLTGKILGIAILLNRWVDNSERGVKLLGLREVMIENEIVFSFCHSCNNFLSM